MEHTFVLTVIELTDMSLAASCTWTSSHFNLHLCWILSGHLVVDMCCHGYKDIYGLFDIEIMRSENYPRILQDAGSKISIRRYVLPLELDKKVD